MIPDDYSPDWWCVLCGCSGYWGDTAGGCDCECSHGRRREPCAATGSGAIPDTRPDLIDLAEAAARVTVMTDPDVIASLAGLWSGSGWRRLEISQVNGRYGGYCVPWSGPPVQTADALLSPACPDVIAQLATLLSAAGWQRLEIIGDPLTGRAGGWCERSDGSGIKLRNIPERKELA